MRGTLALKAPVGTTVTVEAVGIKISTNAPQRISARIGGGGTSGCGIAQHPSPKSRAQAKLAQK